MRLEIRSCVIVMLLQLAPLGAMARDGLTHAGSIKSVVGQVSVERQGTRLAATPGLVLQQGDRVLVGEPGGLSFTLVDDTAITLAARSQAELTEVRFNPTVREGRLHIRLLQGALHITTGQIARQAPQNVRIETPTGVMGVQGTAFIVEGRSRP